MIVKSIYQIVVHLESFRNIELYYQGLYLVKLNVYDSSSENKESVSAHPYAHTENYNPYEPEQGKGKIYDMQILRPAFIVDNSSSFYSKSFVIKFCEEEVELNDFVHFRIEYEIAEEEKSKLIIEASLLFYDYTNIKNGNEKDMKDQKFEDKLLAEAKVVNTKKFSIQNARKGIHEYNPIVFDDHYFSELKMSVHTLCTNYKFRASNLQLSDYAKLSNKQKLIVMEQSKRDKSDRKSVSVYESVIKSLNLKNMPSALQRIDDVLLKEFKETYKSLYQHYNNVSSKCIQDRDKKVFKNYLTPPSKLTLPYQQKSLSKKTFFEQISTKYNSKDNECILKGMLDEVNFISGQLCQLWHKTLDLYKITPRYCIELLQEQWLKNQKEIWKTTIVRKFRVDEDFSHCVEWSDNQKDKVGTQLRFAKRQHQNLQQLNFFPKPDQMPIIFEDIYVSSKSQIPEYQQNEVKQQYRGIHLFVFVHGFQGNSYDMRVIKNYVSFMHPDSLFLCSSSNEDQTNGDIISMGKRLSDQVKDFITEHCQHNTLGRLSFFGHSLGGLKIRAALPHLEEYADKMHTFVSFSSPHLGLLYNSSSLIDAGIWILNKMKNSLCLKQLSMEDAPMLQDCALYHLAQYKGLRWFKHVFLFGSKQDSYSPFESARMEICKDAYNDKKNGHLYIKMVNGLVGEIQSNRLHRLDVSFCIQQRNLDSFIGRTAHIMFLECQPLIKSIVFNYDRVLS